MGYGENCLGWCRKTEWVFNNYFVRQVLRKANAKPSSTCNLPTSVVNYQFEWKDRYYRMFLESCPGKFGAFHQYGLPCDGSNVLRIDPVKKTLEEIDPGSSKYPMVTARNVMQFRVHLMVLFLWGGPNNSPWEMSNALEGDHKRLLYSKSSVVECRTKHKERLIKQAYLIKPGYPSLCLHQCNPIQ